MNILLSLIFFILCCLIANAIKHFYETRLERRIGLSNSFIDLLTFNTPSYSRNIANAVILFASIYIWRENSIIVLFISAILKISTKEKTYGLGVKELSSLVAILASILCAKIIIGSSYFLGKEVLTIVSFLVCIAGAQIFIDRKKEDSAKDTLILITLNASFIALYFRLNNIYALLSLALASYCLQILVKWMRPKLNPFQKMRTDTQTILLTSLILLTITSVWIFFVGVNL